jgi:hypothetical protein
MYHRSKHDSRGYTIDYYDNDPYVWHDPYLWSFCHFSGTHRPRGVKPGSVILWLTRDEGKSRPSDPYFCDLVFIVGRVLKLEEARAQYGTHDFLLDRLHFQAGLQAHPDADLTCEADMAQSFIPYPAVEVSRAIDTMRGNPLSFSWGARKSFLHFDNQITTLIRYIEMHAQHLHRGPLQSDLAALTTLEHPRHDSDTSDQCAIHR